MSDRVKVHTEVEKKRLIDQVQSNGWPFIKEKVIQKYGPDLVEIVEFHPPITLKNAENRKLSPFRQSEEATRYL